MSFKDQIKGSTRRLVLATLDDGTRAVFQIKKIRSIDLVRQGRAELLGAGFTELARQRQITEQFRQNQLEAAEQLADEALREVRIAELRAAWDVEDADLAKKATEALASDLNTVGALLDRLESWVCAAVESAGPFVGEEGNVTPDGLLPAGCPPELAATSMEPVQFVRSAATSESMLVADLGERVVSMIGQAVMTLSLPNQREVQSFRE